MTNVLIVDESRLGRDLVASLLSRLRPDWTMTEASSHGAAREALERTPPDIALVAHSRPDNGSLDLARYLRARFPRLAVALLAAEQVDGGRKDAEDLGCVFIPKPVTPDRLRHFVRQFPC